MLAGPGLKVEAGPPRLAQRVGGGAHHARQRLDAVELAEIRLRQDGRTMASLRASSSTGCVSPPASRAASCSKVIICSPCRRSRAAASRNSFILSRLCATVVRRPKSLASTSILGLAAGLEKPASRHH